MNKEKIRISEKWLAMFVLLMIYACSGSQNQDKSEVKSDTTTKVNTLACDSLVKVRNAEVCLPKFKGFEKCNLTELAQTIKTKLTAGGSTVLGVYRQQCTNTPANAQAGNDYFVLYVPYANNNVLVAPEMLNMLRKTMADRFRDKDGEAAQGKHANMPVFARPEVLEGYSLNKEVETLVVLIKPEAKPAEVLLINMWVADNKMVFLTYYKKHNGEESVKEAKAANAQIVSELIKRNK